MAVQVYADGRNASRHDYGEAEKVAVKDGHLTVTSASGNKVYAIYSPGSWHHADVVKDED
jgi:hypothetical protein